MLTSIWLFIFPLIINSVYYRVLLNFWLISASKYTFHRPRDIFVNLSGIRFSPAAADHAAGAGAGRSGVAVLVRGRRCTECDPDVVRHPAELRRPVRLERHLAEDPVERDGPRGGPQPALLRLHRGERAAGGRHGRVSVCRLSRVGLHPPLPPPLPHPTGQTGPEAAHSPPYYVYIEALERQEGDMAK